MTTLITYPDGTDEPGVEFECKNGFVSRVVGAVANENIPDAQRTCMILNGHEALRRAVEAALPYVERVAGTAPTQPAGIAKQRAAAKVLAEINAALLGTIPQ